MIKQFHGKLEFHLIYFSFISDPEDMGGRTWDDSKHFYVIIVELFAIIGRVFEFSNVFSSNTFT